MADHTWDEAVLMTIFRKRQIAYEAPVTLAEMVAADRELREASK